MSVYLCTEDGDLMVIEPDQAQFVGDVPRHRICVFGDKAYASKFIQSSPGQARAVRYMDMKEKEKRMVEGIVRAKNDLEAYRYKLQKLSGML